MLATRKMGWLVACGLVTAATALSACGGDDDDNGSAAAGGNTAASDGGGGAKGEPIIIYNNSPDTGVDAYPWLKDASKAAAKAVNDAGGIQGRPIEIRSCDTAFDPNKATACAREAVSAGALAVVGSQPAAGDSYVPILKKAGIPAVAIQPNNLGEVTSDMVWPIQGGGRLTDYAAPQVCAALGAKNVKIAYLDIPPAIQQFEYTFSAGLKAAGIPKFGKQPIGLTQKDYSTVAAGLKAGGTNCIVTVIGASMQTMLLKALEQAGYKGRIVVDAAALTPTLADDGSSAEGVYAIGQAQPEGSPDPGLAQMVKEMEANGTKPTTDQLSVNAWVGIHLVADLLKDAPSVDSKSLVAAIKASGLQDKYTATVPFDLSKPVEGVYGPNVKLYTSSVIVSKVEGGKLVPQFGGKPVDVKQFPQTPLS